MKQYIIFSLVLFFLYGCDKDPIPIEAPNITTGQASDVMNTSATVSLSINNVSNSKEVGILYSTDITTITTNNSQKGSVENFKSGDNIAFLTGLSAGTTYYYKAYANDGFNYIYGDIMTFTTDGLTEKNGYTLTQNEVWSGTILLKGDIVVPSGITLTINPGTIINISTATPVYDGGFEAGKIDFDINGSLIINGTSQNIIQLKSAASSPTNNDWEGIMMLGNRLEIAYCDISDSQYGVFCFSSRTSAMKIKNCLFNNMSTAIIDCESLQSSLSYNSFININYGYWLFQISKNSELDYSEFKNNYYDILIDGTSSSITNNASITVNNSNFSGNKLYNLYWSPEGVTNSKITENNCYGITTNNLISGFGNTYTYTNKLSSPNFGIGCGFSSMAKSPSSPSNIIGSNPEQVKRMLQEHNFEIMQQYKKMKLKQTY